MNKSALVLLSTMCTAALLSGCAKEDLSSAGKAGKGDTDTKSTTAATTTGTPAANGGSDQSPSASAGSGRLPNQVKINLADLKDDMVICTVAGKPITVGDYRSMLKLQQTQMQTNIATDPILRMNLLAEAKKRGLTLAADDRGRVIAAATAQHKDLQSFLKEKNITQDQFNKEVEDAGLTYKMSGILIEEGLMSQLVSRELLGKAAIEAGRTKVADDQFQILKNSRNFGDLKARTGLSQDELKNELVKGELAKMQIEKLEKTIHISDADIRHYYDQHKKDLLHGERVRLSSILVLAPQQDIGSIQSVTKQVKAQLPKLEGKELDAKVADVNVQLQNKALILLGEAKAAGSNFAKLANDNTEDPLARQAKRGGDMGWQEKQQLVPQFVTAVWNLTPGTVLNSVVKTNEGFRIMKVTGHEKAGPIGLSDVREAIAAKLRQEKLQEVVSNWVNQQQKIVKIEFSPKFAAVANAGTSTKTN